MEQQYVFETTNKLFDVVFLNKAEHSLSGASRRAGTDLFTQLPTAPTEHAIAARGALSQCICTCHSRDSNTWAPLKPIFPLDFALLAVIWHPDSLSTETGRFWIVVKFTAKKQISRDNWRKDTCSATFQQGDASIAWNIEVEENGTCAGSPLPGWLFGVHSGVLSGARLSIIDDIWLRISSLKVGLKSGDGNLPACQVVRV